MILCRKSAMSLVYKDDLTEKEAERSGLQAQVTAIPALRSRFNAVSGDFDNLVVKLGVCATLLSTVSISLSKSWVTLSPNGSSSVTRRHSANQRQIGASTNDFVSIGKFQRC